MSSRTFFAALTSPSSRCHAAQPGGDRFGRGAQREDSGQALLGFGPLALLDQHVGQRPPGLRILGQGGHKVLRRAPACVHVLGREPGNQLHPPVGIPGVLCQGRRDLADSRLDVAALSLEFGCAPVREVDRLRRKPYCDRPGVPRRDHRFGPREWLATPGLRETRLQRNRPVDRSQSPWSDCSGPASTLTSASQHAAFPGR